MSSNRLPRSCLDSVAAASATTATAAGTAGALATSASAMLPRGAVDWARVAAALCTRGYHILDGALGSDVVRAIEAEASKHKEAAEHVVPPRPTLDACLVACRA